MTRRLLGLAAIVLAVTVVVNDAPVLTAGGAIEVVVAVAEDDLISDVSRGENARRLVAPAKQAAAAGF